MRSLLKTSFRLDRWALAALIAVLALGLGRIATGGGRAPLTHNTLVVVLFDREIPLAVKTIFRRRLDSRLAHVEHHLVQNAYLLGSHFSTADVYLFVVSNWARSVNLDLSPYPSILALRKRVGVRPAVQEAMKAEGLTP